MAHPFGILGTAVAVILAAILAYRAFRSFKENDAIALKFVATAFAVFCIRGSLLLWLYIAEPFSHEFRHSLEEAVVAAGDLAVMILLVLPLVNRR